MEDILRELVDFLKEASPFLWETLRRQVYLDAASLLAWFVLTMGLIGGSVYLIRYSTRKNETDQYGDWNMGVIGGYCLAIGCGMIAFALLLGTIRHFMNPDYYAIELILNGIQGQ